jgi:L-threonylcarbamoyladenylate synthase
MNTKILKIDPKKPEIVKIKYAAAVIRKGGLVAFPTETVYGLGADGLNTKAVRSIFKAKGRPQDNPLILHIADKKDIYWFGKDVPGSAERLVRKFWPGPLTIVVKKSKLVPKVVTAGLDTVGLRMPDSSIALALIRESGVPIAAPSANISGRPSPTSGMHVISDLDRRIDMIIDAGSTNIGVESTVLDLTTKPATILRPGGVTIEQLKRVLGKVNVHKPCKNDAAAKSPGMKYRHYSPHAKIVLVEGKADRAEQKIVELMKHCEKEKMRIGIISGEKLSQEALAKDLFRLFRNFDEKGVDIIIAEGVEEKGLGLAIMNRLRKAAYKIIRV